MLVPALVAAASTMSVAVERPPGAMPGTRAPRLAVATAAGDVLISPDGGVSWHLAARCSMVRAATDPALDSPGAGLHGQLAIESLPEAEVEPGAPSELDEDPHHEDQTRAWSPGPGAPSTCGSPGATISMAWFQEALYVACPGEPLRRWHPETGLRPVITAPTTAGTTGPGAASGADASPAPGQEPSLRDVVAMTGGTALLWLAGSRNELWTLDAGARLTSIGAVPEPVRALARWQGTLVAAGATTVWQGPAPWQPIAPLRACALSASQERLWIAGPEGLTELATDQLRVRSMAPATGVAVHGQDVWLASGRGPLLHTTTTLAHLTAPAPPSDPGAAPGSAPLGTRAYQRAARRARWSRWLPRLVAQIQWTRARGRMAVDTHAPWREPLGAARTRGLTVLVLLSWTLDPDDATTTALQEGIP